MKSIRKVALACMTAAMVTISVNAGAQGPRQPGHVLHVQPGG